MFGHAKAHLGGIADERAAHVGERREDQHRDHDGRRDFILLKVVQEHLTADCNDQCDCGHEADFREPGGAGFHWGRLSARPAKVQRQEREVPTELGAHNPRLDDLRALATPKGRRESGTVAIEGPTLIEEAERSGARITALYLTEAGRFNYPYVADLESADIPAFLLNDRLFAKISDVETPTGVLATIELGEQPLEALLGLAGPLVLFAGLGDPGNAGTLLRAAEAFGFAGAIFGSGSVDPFSAKVVRAAMGSLFRLPVARASVEALVAGARESNRPIVATDLGGVFLADADLPKRGIYAIGNERHGVRSWLPQADLTVTIPQAGPTESLNAAVAGGILFYEYAKRQ